MPVQGLSSLTPVSTAKFINVVRDARKTRATPGVPHINATMSPNMSMT